MLNFLSKIIKKAPSNKPIKIQIHKGTSITFVQGKQGDNLMDVTNKIVNSNSNIYGLCNKQLACTTCSVNIKSHHYSKLPKAKEQELDILVGLRHYKTNQTRMACQIFLQPELEGMIVEIPGDKMVI